MIHYTRELGHELFINVVERLGNSANSEDAALDILTETCSFFGFGCGFIYEADHTGVFFLQEHYSIFEDVLLPEQLNLNQVLGHDFMEQLSVTSVIFCHADNRQEDFAMRFCHTFSDVNTLLAIPIVDEESKVIGLIGMMDRRREILLTQTEIKAAQSVLRILANNVKLRIYQRMVSYTQISLTSVMDNMGIDIYVNDFLTHEMLYSNKSMAEPYGGFEKMKGKKCYEALYHNQTEECDFCPQKKLIDEEGNPTRAYSWDYERPFDGSWFRVFSAAFRWLDGRLAHVVSSVDITENKKNELLVREMAELDTLTGLPNRRKLLIDLDRMIRENKENGSTGYLLFLDMDNFKEINDTFGHHAGDETLIRITANLNSEPLIRNHLYRHGGDEFVILYDNISYDQLLQVVRAVSKMAKTAIPLKDGSVLCSVSVGITSFPRVKDTSDSVLFWADSAMYKAKREGRDRFWIYGEKQPLFDF